MREDVKRALEAARALPKVSSDNTHAVNQRLTQLETLFNQLPDVANSSWPEATQRLTQLETLCNELPGGARGAFMRHLAHEGLIEMDIDLESEMLLSLCLMMGNNFNGLHAAEVLRLRGVEDVAQVVEDHTLKVFVRLFGIEGTVHLNDELQAKGKRQCLEGELGL